MVRAITNIQALLTYTKMYSKGQPAQCCAYKICKFFWITAIQRHASMNG